MNQKGKIYTKNTKKIRSNGNKSYIFYHSQFELADAFEMKKKSFLAIYIQFKPLFSSQMFIVVVIPPFVFFRNKFKTLPFPSNDVILTTNKTSRDIRTTMVCPTRPY